LDVSLGKASRTAEGLAERIFEMDDAMESGRRARSATARFPCEGEERIRAIPEPWSVVVSLLCVVYVAVHVLTVFGPAPMRIARPDGAIVLVSEWEMLR
jgi:hypothetical protein